MKGQTGHRESGRIRRAIVLWIFLGFVPLILLLSALVLVHRSMAESAVRDKLAELEAAGVTVSGEQVNRLYHGHGRDPAGNAAPLYQEAMAQKVADREAMNEINERLRLYTSFEPLDAESVAVIGGYLSANRVAIDLLKEAAGYPFLRYDLDFTEGVALLIPHVGDLRESTRLLSAEAIHAAEVGDADRAGAALEAMFGIARQIAEEPTLISHLTGIAIAGISQSTLERVLNRVELSFDTLVALTESIRSIETGPRLRAAMNGEVALGISIYRMIEEGEADLRELDFVSSGWEGLFLPFYQISGLLARDKLFYLEQLEQLLQVVDSPVGERLDKEPMEEHFSANPFHARIVVGNVLPTLDRVIEADNRAITSLRAAQVALAVERYRMDAGRLPSSPDDLAPEFMESLPVDPYSADGAFQFVREEGAFFVRGELIIDYRGERGEAPLQFRLPLR